MEIVQQHLSRDFDIIEIFSVNDLHVGDPLHDGKMFDRFLKMIKEQDNRFIVLAGDLIDNPTRNSVGDTYESLMSPQEQKEFVIEKLEPIADRILFICDGNHEARNVRGDGQLITRDIAFALKKKDVYRAPGGFLQVTFGAKRNGKRRSYVGYITHGSGGGATSGNALNKVESLSYFAQADFYIMGHNHKRIVADNVVQLRPDTRNGIVRAISPICIVAGAWMDYGGYGQFKMYRPGGKGTVPLRLYAKKRCLEGVLRV